jgi:hypothetical protein
MEMLEMNIVQIICKLKMMFSPLFFDSIEHLPIDLPFEEKVGGPVQYRWIYRFERLGITHASCHNLILGYSPIHIFSLFKKYKKIKNIIKKYNSEKRMSEHSENGQKLVKEVQKFKD